MGEDKDRKAVPILASSKGKENEEAKKKNGKEEKEKQKKNNNQQDDLSEEDKKKKEEIDLLVRKIQDPDENIVKEALNKLTIELQIATSSMTSVPKPLKFLHPHYEDLVDYYKLINNINIKKELADILSILSSTCNTENKREMLRYRLEGSMKNLTIWSQEYLRNLSTEISIEYIQRRKNQQSIQELIDITLEIVEYYIKHGAECDAVDLLCEVDKIESLINFVDSNTFKRAGLYLLSMANYAASYEECLKMLKVVFDIFLSKGEYPDALRVSMKMNNIELIKCVMHKCEDKTTKQQLAIMCARQRIDLDLLQIDEEYNTLCSGEMLSNNFQLLAKELDVVEPKLPEDVYKTHLEEGNNEGIALDSAKQNLAATFVNAFVNAAFCKDKLMTIENSTWLNKNKDHGILSSTASLGVLYLWNIDEGLNRIDKYQYSNDNYIKCGSLIAFGLIASGIKNECDATFALLSDHLDSNNSYEKLGAILGLGYAYAGSRREDLLEVLAPCIIETSFNIECSSMAALSCGLIFVGSCNQEAAEAIIQTMLERQNILNGLDDPLAVFFAVGLGLLYLGCREDCEITLTALEAIKHPLRKYAISTVEGMAYAYSGDVLKVQRMLKLFVDSREENSSSNNNSDEETSYNFDKSVSVINIPLIALGEEIGFEMVLRTLDHILQYGEIHERRSIPLALALHSASNPRGNVVDLLSKLSHDADADVALHAIISLGIVGAGTNNSRIASLLRQLAAYYAKDSNAMFVVRIAQGLLYIGKGLLTINPLHSDRFLMNAVSLGCLLVVIHACLNLRSTILGRQHYLLYHLVPAMYPRMLLTVDEELNPLPVTVRVGQAVDTIGLVGQPKTITGFQTHTTPVLLSYGERAELASEEYISVTSVLEGVVILKKNPDYKPTDSA